MKRTWALIAFAFVLASCNLQSVLPVISGCPTGVALIHVTNFSGNTITSYELTANGNVPPCKTTNLASAGFVHADSLFEDLSGKIYVTQDSPATVAVFSSYRSNVPTQAITGGATGLNGTIGVAADSSDTYAANCGAGNITAYAAGATGNALPVSTRGGFTCLAELALDSSDNLYVTLPDQAAGIGIDVFAPGPNGNLIRQIMGPDTQLNSPRPMAFDTSGNLYVGNSGAILVFGPGASGDATPINVITGAATQLGRVTGLAFDSAGDLYATNCSNCSGGSGATAILVFAPGATGNQAPLRVISGSNTRLDAPTDIAVGP